MFSFSIYLIGAILSLNFYLTSAAITSYENVLEFEAIYTKEYYFKVPKSLPTSVKYTLIDSTYYPNTRVSLKYICLSKCSTEPTCALACFDETTCTTYYSLIAEYWTPSSSDTLETFTETCYSNWKFFNDITESITELRSTDSYNNYAIYAVENVFSGIYTYHYHYTYLTKSGIDNYIRIDFGAEVKITKVIVALRNQASYGTKFEDIDLRIGTGSATVVDSCCSTEPPTGSMIIFTGEEPWFGRYIWLRRKSEGILTMGEIKVIG